MAVSDRKTTGHKIIRCPYCGYRIDLTVTKPQTNLAGDRFVSCPNPETFSSYSFTNKPKCGQFIKLDDDDNVVEG